MMSRNEEIPKRVNCIDVIKYLSRLEERVAKITGCVVQTDLDPIVKEINEMQAKHVFHCKEKRRIQALNVKISALECSLTPQDTAPVSKRTRSRTMTGPKRLKSGSFSQSSALASNLLNSGKNTSGMSGPSSGSQHKKRRDKVFLGRVGLPDFSTSTPIEIQPTDTPDTQPLESLPPATPDADDEEELLPFDISEFIDNEELESIYQYLVNPNKGPDYSDSEGSDAINRAQQQTASDEEDEVLRPWTGMDEKQSVGSFSHLAAGPTIQSSHPSPQRLSSSRAAGPSGLGSKRLKNDASGKVGAQVSTPQRNRGKVSLAGVGLPDITTTTPIETPSEPTDTTTPEVPFEYPTQPVGGQRSDAQSIPLEQSGVEIKLEPPDTPEGSDISDIMDNDHLLATIDYFLDPNEGPDCENIGGSDDYTMTQSSRGVGSSPHPTAGSTIRSPHPSPQRNTPRLVTPNRLTPAQVYEEQTAPSLEEYSQFGTETDPHLMSQFPTDEELRAIDPTFFDYLNNPNEDSNYENIVGSDDYSIAQSSRGVTDPQGHNWIAINRAKQQDSSDEEEDPRSSPGIGGKQNVGSSSHSTAGPTIRSPQRYSPRPLTPVSRAQGYEVQSAPYLEHNPKAHNKVALNRALQEAIRRALSQDSSDEEEEPRSSPGMGGTQNVGSPPHMFAGIQIRSPHPSLQRSPPRPVTPVPEPPTQELPAPGLEEPEPIAPVVEEEFQIEFKTALKLFYTVPTAEELEVIKMTYEMINNRIKNKVNDLFIEIRDMRYNTLKMYYQPTRDPSYDKQFPGRTEQNFTHGILACGYEHQILCDFVEGMDNPQSVRFTQYVDLLRQFRAVFENYLSSERTAEDRVRVMDLLTRRQCHLSLLCYRDESEEEVFATLNATVHTLEQNLQAIQSVLDSIRNGQYNALTAEQLIRGIETANNMINDFANNKKHRNIPFFGGMGGIQHTTDRLRDEVTALQGVLNKRNYQPFPPPETPASTVRPQQALPVLLNAGQQYLQKIKAVVDIGRRLSRKGKIVEKHMNKLIKLVDLVFIKDVQPHHIQNVIDEIRAVFQDMENIRNQ